MSVGDSADNARFGMSRAATLHPAILKNGQF
jgi:hypothetical protein